MRPDSTALDAAPHVANELRAINLRLNDVQRDLALVMERLAPADTHQAPPPHQGEEVTRALGSMRPASPGEIVLPGWFDAPEAAGSMRIDRSASPVLIHFAGNRPLPAP